jgi:hypothetical protein
MKMKVGHYYLYKDKNPYYKSKEECGIIFIVDSERYRWRWLSVGQRWLENEWSKNTNWISPIIPTKISSKIEI